MCALLTFMRAFLLDVEARISVPGFVSITKDPVHLLCGGNVGPTNISNVVKFCVSGELCGLANDLMIISVEISSNILYVILTTMVAIMSTRLDIL